MTNLGRNDENMPLVGSIDATLEEQGARKKMTLKIWAETASKFESPPCDPAAKVTWSLEKKTRTDSIFGNGDNFKRGMVYTLN